MVAANDAAHVSAVLAGRAKRELANLGPARGARAALWRSAPVLLCALLVAAGCQSTGEGGGGTSPNAPKTVRLVEREVEAPHVFSLTQNAAWDGRASMAGVWVASSQAGEPERVIMRSPQNGRFVIGTLFKRETTGGGAPLQISSEAALALGLLAGQVAPVQVTALRRESGPAPQLDARNPLLDGPEIASAEIAATMAAPAPTVSAAIGAAASPAVVAEAAPTRPAVPAAPVQSVGGKNRVQIGLFSVEDNANRAAQRLRQVGVKVEILPENSQGKALWRVTAGPAAPQEREALLQKVKSIGFVDAFYVAR